MTFWQVSLSFKAHLAHLPSPVMVTSLPASAANDGVASGSKSSPAMPVNSAILFFIITSFFWFICVLPWVRYRQKIRQFGGRFCSKVCPCPNPCFTPRWKRQRPPKAGRELCEISGSGRKRAFSGGAFLGGFLGEDQPVILRRHENGIAIMENAFEDLLGQGVFEGALDGAAHRAGAVLRIVPFADQEVFSLLVELENDIPRFEPL